MPHHRSCRRAQRHDRVGVAVVTGSLPAEVVRARAPGRHEHEIAGGVGGDHRPRVGRAGRVGHHATPALPCRVGRVARNRIPAPAQLAGARVESPHLATRRVRAVVVGDRGAGDDQSVDHGRRRGELVLLLIGRSIVQSLSEVDASRGAEVRAGTSGAGIEGDELRVDRAEVDPPPTFCVGRCGRIDPGGHAAICVVAPVAADVDLGIVRPALAPGDRIERDDATEGCGEIQRPVHHERRRLEVRIALHVESRSLHFTRAICPGDGERGDVVARDLRQRRIARVVRVASVRAPLPAGRLRECWSHSEYQTERDANHCDPAGETSLGTT
jgi:hypothetical protein